MKRSEVLGGLIQMLVFMHVRAGFKRAFRQVLAAALDATALVHVHETLELESSTRTFSGNNTPTSLWNNALRLWLPRKKIH
jgi:hypothetical protein